MTPDEHPNVKLPLAFMETPLAVIDGILVSKKDEYGYIYSDDTYLGMVIDGEPMSSVRNAIATGTLSEHTFATILALLQLHR